MTRQGGIYLFLCIVRWSCWCCGGCWEGLFMREREREREREKTVDEVTGKSEWREGGGERER